MKDPYCKLISLRRALLRDYDADKLHKLRIALRRMRSMLKSRSEPEARELRDELGRLADTTNAARDRDTLAIYAAAHLKKSRYRRIEPWLEANSRSAHRRVICKLRSRQWSKTMRRWKRYTRADHDDAGRGEVVIEESDVAQSLERLLRRRDRALARDNPSRWHKVRIAIKDLRYQLDSLEGAESQDEIALCKRLQECLGRWHDCVVHDELLSELAVAMNPKRDSRPAKAVQKLRRRLEAERKSSLKTARAILTASETETLFSRARQARGRRD